jgi:hypothetical protein
MPFPFIFPLGISLSLFLHLYIIIITAQNRDEFSLLPLVKIRKALCGYISAEIIGRKNLVVFS